MHHRMVAVACFLPGQDKDLSEPTRMCNNQLLHGMIYISSPTCAPKLGLAMNYLLIYGNANMKNYTLLIYNKKNYLLENTIRPKIKTGLQKSEMHIPK
jgi:hypothetical protein